MRTAITSHTVSKGVVSDMQRLHCDICDKVIDRTATDRSYRVVALGGEYVVRAKVWAKGDEARGNLDSCEDCERAILKAIING